MLNILKFTITTITTNFSGHRCYICSSLTKSLLQVLLCALDVVYCVLGQGTSSRLSKFTQLQLVPVYTGQGWGGVGGGLLICDRLVSHPGGFSDFYPLIIKEMAD